MIHKWLEDWFDSLLYLGVMMGLLIFSVHYWKSAYQIRYAELVTNEFLNNVSISGRISGEDLEELLQRIHRIAPNYEVELAYTGYMLQPCYAQIPKVTLDEYYMKRNKRKEITFPAYAFNVKEEKAESLHYQKETNATILAAMGAYLPLPEGEKELMVEAVRKQQEVYKGEELITVCRVLSDKGSYYVEAEPVSGSYSGIVELEVVVEGEVIYVPVEVICYARNVTCANGHSVVNTEAVVDTWKQTGEIKCPYCAVIPDRLKCNVELLSKRTGEKFIQEELWLEVVYLDGHAEVVTPHHGEWLDDYDENYCGLQPVTISFRGKTTIITVVSENGACKRCGAFCSGRAFSDYVDFPYCTTCMSEVLLFTGEVYEEEKKISFGEIVALLDQGKEIICKEGDMIQVRLSENKRVKTLQYTTIKKDGNER